MEPKAKISHAVHPAGGFTVARPVPGTSIRLYDGGYGTVQHAHLAARALRAADQPPRAERGGQTVLDLRPDLPVELRPISPGPCEAMRDLRQQPFTDEELRRAGIEW